MAGLREALEALKKEDRVSFHMPGHKYGGCGLKASFNSFWDIDVTEIPGADNLHDPETILLEAKAFAMKTYGSRESFFLVNGSSCGIMAMIMGSVKRGEKIVISRDAHRSVHQAVSLGGLHPIYLMPKVDPSTGIAIGLDEVALEEALTTHRDIKAVVCTYPSYSGACVDFPSIRRITAENGILLLVDEAHGAHLWLDDSLPPSALDLGGDVVVQSLHKTMPAMTQTAILHLGTDKANRDEIVKYLGIFQSSSPSYVLMCSIDESIRIGAAMGRERMAILLEEIRAVKALGRRLGFEFWDKASLKPEYTWAFDETKLCLSAYSLGLDGYELDELLRSQGIQSEYAMKSHVLLMTSIANEPSDFQCLGNVLENIPQGIKASDREAEKLISEEVLPDILDQLSQVQSEMVVLPAQIDGYELENCFLDKAEGEIAGEWLIPYPPGVPILCPGERIQRRHITILESYLSKEHKVLGIKDKKIRILAL